MVGDGCDEFSVQYNVKDVIQYALSVGAGSNILTYSQNIQYVFEDHVNFSVLPTFASALIFWAKRSGDDCGIGNTSTITQFPPPIMRSMGVIPNESLKTNVDVHKYPLIHTSQSIVWDRDLPIPTTTKNYIKVMIKGKFLSVDAKSVGTFVKTEYALHEQINDAGWKGLRRIGSVQFTTLILGIPSNLIKPYKNITASLDSINPCIHSDSVRSLLVDWTTKKKRLLPMEVEHYIHPNTALLYRLASGDFNPMHIDPNAVPDMGHNDKNHNEKEKLPFIHGLCTLGITARIILNHVQTHYCDHNFSIRSRYLDCRFKAPVFINDIIVIRAWEKLARSYMCDENKDGTVSVEFTVALKASNSILVDSGMMVFSLIPSNEDSSKLRSYL
jgi:acyl dehydratase